MTILAGTAEGVIPEGTWTIDPAHSTVEFAVRHLGLATVKGRATKVSGTITGGAEPAIEGVVEASSLTTFDETRDGHLQSPDFLDAGRFPTLRFHSTRVEAKGDALVVAGELTIRGVTRPVVLEGRFSGRGSDPFGNERIGIELQGTIDRTAFGVSWNAPVPGGGFLLPDEIPVWASFSAVRSG